MSSPRAPRRLLNIGFWAVLAASAGALAFAWLWPEDLTREGPAFVALSHTVFLIRVFRFHIGLGVGLVLAWSLARRTRRVPLAAGVIGGVCVAPAAWSLLPGSGRAAAPGEATLCVMSVNLMYGGTDAGATLAEIRRRDPDVILFQEWTDAAGAALRPLLAGAYPHSVEAPRDDAFGQAVFSRLPFAEPARLYLQPEPGRAWAEPQVRAAVQVGNSTVVIYNVHLLPPVSMEYIREQRRMAASLARVAAREIGAGTRVIFAGDFNAAPGTAHLRAMEGAGLRGALDAAGRGRAATWPRTSSLRFLPGLRLDHLLAGPGLRALGAGTGRDIGSDHRPVWGAWALVTPALSSR